MNDEGTDVKIIPEPEVIFPLLVYSVCFKFDSFFEIFTQESRFFPSSAIQQWVFATN